MAERKNPTPAQVVAFVRELPVGGFAVLEKGWHYTAPQVTGPELATDLPRTEMTIRRVSFATFTVEFGGPLPAHAVEALARTLATL